MQGSHDSLQGREVLVDCTEDVGRVVRDFIRYGPNIHHPTWFYNGVVPDDGPDEPSAKALAELESLPERIALDGEIDPDIELLSFRRTDGSAIGTLVRFSCHPVVYHTSYGTLSNAVSADFPGVLTREVAKATDAPALFLQGTAGNIKPLVVSVSDMADEMERVGNGLAGLVIGALEDLQHEPLTRIRFVRVEEDFRTAPHRLNTREGDFERAQKAYAAAQKSRFDPAELRDALDDVMRKWAADHRHEEQATSRLPFSLIGFNETAIATLPGEMFAEFGLEIKGRCGRGNVIVVSLADSSTPSYVPDREAFKSGGYEVAVSALVEGSGERMVEIASAMLRDFLSAGPQGVL